MLRPITSIRRAARNGLPSPETTMPADAGIKIWRREGPQRASNGAHFQLIHSIWKFIPRFVPRACACKSLRCWCDLLLPPHWKGIAGQFAVVPCVGRGNACAIISAPTLGLHRRA